MLRRDYLLQMIQEFTQALARIGSLKKGQRWDEAGEALDAEFQRLIGAGPQAVARFSETELLARLVEGESTQVVHQKTLILTALLTEAGDVAVAQDRVEQSRECYLKALHLLLDILARGEVSEYPEFVPKVEMLKEALQGAPLPVGTHARLMQHYESTGEFSRAEDALFAMLDADPDNDAIVEFGVVFYQRLLTHRDATLNEANLPRAEVEEGLRELQSRRKHGG
jgi:tetratricopeptide (TPR) repeat protein